MPSKHLCICVKHFIEDSFEQNIEGRRLLGPYFKHCQIVVKKDAVPTIFNFTMECCKAAIGQKTTKNKRIMPTKQWANSSAISPDK